MNDTINEFAPYYSGQFLLALPGMGDPRFEKAVIAICTHDEEGALGIGIGQLFGDMKMGELFDQLGLEGDHGRDVPVHYGGPVDQSRGFVLHSRDWTGNGQDSVEVGDKWALTNSLDVLRAISEGEGPRQWVVSLGYAGWSPGQLEEEMHHHAWHVTPGSDELLFTTATDERWAKAYADDGVDVRLLSAMGGNA